MHSQLSIELFCIPRTVSLLPKSLVDSLTFGHACLGDIPKTSVALLQILRTSSKIFVAFLRGWPLLVEIGVFLTVAADVYLEVCSSNMRTVHVSR